MKIARTRLNHGKQGRGSAGSSFRSALEIWGKSNQIYYNGTHADYASLSIYNRPSDRNNQSLEGSHNGSINLDSVDSSFSSEGTLLRWLNTSKKEERGFTVRQYQITHLNSAPKRKNKAAISKDKALSTIINQHKERQISTRERLDKYISLKSEHSLPRTLRRFDYMF